ncbi:dihydrofolate reductase family protein [Microbacterium sp. W1N]|uniref:dihydrofolate reductase family protein n=1 Tax=Microbacterium festucae TaxID=2977531 RepID=UPI0021BF7672|nr:dihydrofolate reductase family protein [Microbacterium festucae]MCT9820814.1 dihydrofolate reductase family protein [Microbacterium festucae]
MRKLVYFVATTLDGFIAAPDRGDPSGQEYFPITPDLVAYIAENYAETLPAPARDALGIVGPPLTFDTVVEGRKSYEIGLAAGITNAYPHLRHIVFSRTVTDSPDPAVEIVSSDPTAYVRELKSQPGSDIWLVGGGAIAAALLPEIDRLILKQNPSVIGSGVPLFDGPFVPTLFQPVDEILLDGGVRVLTFDRRAHRAGA